MAEEQIKETETPAVDIDDAVYSKLLTNSVRTHARAVENAQLSFSEEIDEDNLLPFIRAVVDVMMADKRVSELAGSDGDMLTSEQYMSYQHEVEKFAEFWEDARRLIKGRLEHNQHLTALVTQALEISLIGGEYLLDQLPTYLEEGIRLPVEVGLVSLSHTFSLGGAILLILPEEMATGFASRMDIQMSHCSMLMQDLYSIGEPDGDSGDDDEDDEVSEDA